MSGLLVVDHSALAVRDRKPTHYNQQPAKYGDPLTARECEVLDELIKGWSAKEIAQVLGLSLYTVKHYMEIAETKTGARNNVRLGVLYVVARAQAAQAAADEPDLSEGWDPMAASG
jgi:DNA-binding NarL/FixJ family response regulator